MSNLYKKHFTNLPNLGKNKNLNYLFSLSKRQLLRLPLLLSLFLMTSLTTNLQAQSDCQGQTLAYWSLDQCSSGSEYTEFTADTYTLSGFENVTASIFSNNGDHSCTPGQSGVGVCSDSKDDCNWKDNDDNAYKFSVTLTPKQGTTVSLTGFSFYEKAPLLAEWIGGNSRANNPPTKYGWRILKNGVEIGQWTNKSVTPDWSLEEINFEDLGVNTKVSTQTTFSFELLGYCRSGNISGFINAWDIDEVKVYGCSNPTVETTTLTICAGESITIGSPTDNARYDWNNNIKTKSQVVSPARTTTYKVQSNTGSFADGTFQAYYHHFNVRVEDCGTTSPPDPLCGVDQCYVPIYGDPMALFKFDNCVEGNSFANYSSATTSNNSCYNVSNTNIGSTYGQSGHPLSPYWGSNLYECEEGSSGVYSTENRIAFLQNVPGLTYEDVQDQYHYVEMTVSPNECGSISCVTFHLDIFEYGYWSPDKFYLRVKQNGNEVALVKDIEDVSGLCDIYQICFDEAIEFSETSTFSFEFYSYGDKYNRTSWPDAATQMHIDDFAIHGGCGSVIAGGDAAINASISKSNDLSCNQLSANLIANPSGQSYKWSVGGSISRTLNVNSLGTYNVTVTNSGGCEEVASITVNRDNQAPNASISKSNDITCDNNKSTLTVEPAGLSYRWDFGSQNRITDVFAPGTYSVTITANNGCSSVKSIVVNDDRTIPTINLKKSNELSCAQSSATLTANVSGGQVHWNTGQIGTSIQVASAGTYSATVTGTNGCTTSATITLSGACNPTARVGNQVFNDTNNNGFKDNNEPGINGVEVKLLDDNGNFIASMTTANDGIYSFEDLTAGFYKIMFGTPNGFIASPRTGFGDNDADNNNDNNPANGNMTDVFYLSNGESNPTIDAGFFAGTICDNLNYGGKIGFGSVCAGSVEICGSDAIPTVENCIAPSGGSGEMEYIWLKNEVSCDGPTGSVAQMLANPGAYNWKILPNINDANYTPSLLTTSTCFLRCARRVGCDIYSGESNIVRIEVNANCGGNDNNGQTTETCGNGASITYGNGSIAMDGGSFYQIFDENWQTIYNCGWQCGSSKTVDNLANGEYRVIIKDGSYNVVCEKVITLSTSTDGDNTSDNDTGSGSTDNGDSDTGNTDGSTNGDNTNGESTTVSCDGGTSITYGNGTITMQGGSFYQILDAGWNEVFNCGWQCGSSKTADGLAEGEYRIYIKDNNYSVICEKVITLSANTGGGDTDSGSTDGGNTGGDDTGSGNTGGTTVTCGELTITYGEGTVSMVGQTGQSYYFKINDLNNGWAQAFGCGWNCGHEQTATNLPNSRYLITISNGDWSKHCEVEITMSNSSYTQGAGSRSAPQLNFEAFNAQRAVDLQWLTNSGYKAEYFEVERSTDGAHFESLEKSINKEWGEKLAYHQTTDLTPSMGTNYYRVKEVYLDGSFTYTDIKLVDFNIDVDQLSIYPNPVENVLNLNLKPIIGKSTTINIVNGFGQVVQKHVLGIVNEETVQIELNNTISNGFYQVLIEVEGQKSIAKKLIVKRLY